MHIRYNLSNFTHSPMQSFTPLVLFALLFLCACKDSGPRHKKPIPLGDPNGIVTETDSQFLQNFTEDISPVKAKSSEKQITEMMVQVDSLKASKKLEEESKVPQRIQGFTVNFAECSVTFNGLLAHALNVTQDERKLNSVSYLKDGGQFLEMKLQVNGLSDLKVEQRLTTKLYIEQDGESFLLADLGKFITPWYNLAGKEDVFVSVGSNSLSFHPVDQTKIKNALDRELRKKKKDRKAIEAWMKQVAQTKSYADAPCVLKMFSSQWRIIGMKDGKRVQKLIQFDEPQP